MSWAARMMRASSSSSLPTILARRTGLPLVSSGLPAEARQVGPRRSPPRTTSVDCLIKTQPLDRPLYRVTFVGCQRDEGEQFDVGDQIATIDTDQGRVVIIATWSGVFLRVADQFFEMDHDRIDEDGVFFAMAHAIDDVGQQFIEAAVLIDDLALYFHAWPRMTQAICFLVEEPVDIPNTVAGFTRIRPDAFEHSRTHVEVEAIVAALRSVVLVQSWIPAITSSDMIDATSERAPSLVVLIFVRFRRPMYIPIFVRLYRWPVEGGGARFPQMGPSSTKGTRPLLHVNTAANASFHPIGWDPLGRPAT
jgi:hypothetical protein